MTKKKIIILSFSLITLISLAIGSYYLFFYENKPKTKVGFQFDNTYDLDRIKITDAFSKSFTIIRNGNNWTDIEGRCINQECVENIMEAVTKIQFKAFLNEKSENNFLKKMQTNHTKVEFYEKGEWTKTWYIGPAAQDHNGQIMILDAPNMKGQKPVIMAIRGMYGIIKPRFFTDPKLWMCTNIFKHEMEEIKSVNIDFPLEPYRNFNIMTSENGFQITSNNQKLKEVDTMNIYRYLQNYKKVHFESANFSLSQDQIDSLKNTTPFCNLQLTLNSNKYSTLKMYRLMADDPQENEFGELVNMDLNKFWCQLDNGDIVKCQYFVFNPLILGHIYFPSMNLNFPKS